MKLNFRKEISGEVEHTVENVTQLLKEIGFGILTRIDFHSKMKEKLNKEIPPTVILGACNPQLAYEAYLQNPDVMSLLPCNVVVREIGKDRLSIEIVRPSAMMVILGDSKLVQLAEGADQSIKQVLEKL